MRSLGLRVSDVLPASKFYLGRHFLKPMIKEAYVTLFPFVGKEADVP